MYVCVRALILELELQTVVNCHVGVCWELDPSRLGTVTTLNHRDISPDLSTLLIQSPDLELI